MIKSYFTGIWRDRYILISLVQKDLQQKYRRSKLGALWSVLTPLGLVVIIGSVYSILFNTDPKVFIPMLFAGLNPWLFISGTADSGTIAFLAAEGYLKQTTVNAQIFPLRVTLANFVNLLYSVAAFFAVYVFLRPEMFSLRMLMCIPGLAIMLIFVWGLANFAAVLHLNYRDYQPLQSLILQALFYATPVIYQPEMLAARGYALFYELNPFYYLIEIVRTPMQGKPLPEGKMYLIAVTLAFVVFFTSIFAVMRQKSKIAMKL